jgi:hypothetical protein
MPRSTFYYALLKLAEEGEIEVSEAQEIQITRTVKGENTCRNSGNSSKIPAACPKFRQPVQNSGNPSKIPANDDAKPLPANEVKPSSYSYQILINSLSEESERERAKIEKAEFLKFCQRKSHELKNPIILYESWLKTVIISLWEDWKARDAPRIETKDQNAPSEEILEQINQAIANPNDPAIFYDPAFKMIQVQEEGKSSQWLHLDEWLEIEQYHNDKHAKNLDQIAKKQNGET